MNMPSLTPLDGRKPALTSLTKSVNDGSVSSAVRPAALSTLSPQTKTSTPLEVSALAAFAKKTIALPATSALTLLVDRAPTKGLNELTLTYLDAKTEATANELTFANGSEQKEVKDAGESKPNDAPGQRTAMPTESAPEKSQESSTADNKATYDMETDEEDSMAEFAFIDSEEEESQDDAKIAVDTDELYDQENDDEEHDAFLRAKERIFVPQTSKQDLFHAILVQDIGLLTRALSWMDPSTVLDVRDSEGRTMYHYAALSRSPEVQAVVFNFVGCYLTQETNHQVTAIESKQQRLAKWEAEKKHKNSRWIPPRVREIQTSFGRLLTEEYQAVLSAYDCNGRSFLHYSAMNHYLSPVQVSRHLARVLKASHCALLQTDTFGRDALSYAILTDNELAYDVWFTEVGLAESLVTNDISRLAQLKMSQSTQRKLHKLLEEHDTIQYARKQPSTTSNFGLSLHFITQCSSGVDVPSKVSGTRMWTSLHKAVVYGQVEAVRRLIDQGAAVSGRDADGWTALHHCASLCSAVHLVIAEVLLENGANANATSHHGRTPLHLTAMRHSDMPEQFSTTITIGSSEQLQCAAYLCQHGAKLDLCDEDNYTPFLAAVRVGNIAMAHFLLETNCDGVAKDKNGSCALHIAVSHGQEEMVRFLCWWDAQAPVWRFIKDHRGRSPKALVNGDSVIRQHLDNLWYGASLGDVDLVRQQIQLYRSTHEKRERAKHVWVHDKTPITHRTALHVTIEPFIESKLHSLKIPRHQSSTQAATQIVSLLVEEGASIDVGDKWGITPLMLAACIESPLIIKTMLKVATENDLQATDTAGNLAIHYSYAFCRAKTSSVIEETMEDADIKNHDGKTPFAVTAYRDKLFPAEYRTFLSQCGKLASTQNTNRTRE